MTRKIRWGILSTALIGTQKVIPAMQRGQYCDIVGLASRDLARAQATASALGIPKAYGSYEALLADPDIDAIYNPMPNHLHVPWAIKALEAGKHVLCEKPIALTTAESEQLLAAAQAHPHLKVMEAFMYRHHPQWVMAKRLVTEGAIGELRNIQSIFTYFNVDPANVRNMDGIGGGGLMDIGCYTISLARFLFNTEPKRVVGVVDYDPTFKTDRVASAMLDFGNGNTSGFVCATQLSSYQRINAIGTQGRIEIEIPFNAPPDKPCKMWLQQGGKIEETVFDICDQYTIQGDLMSQAILNDTPVPTPIADAVANMRVIEAIVASDKKGGWVTL